MAQYIASYDLHHERHHPAVAAALEKMGAIRLLESLWVLSSSLTAAQIRDTIKAAADVNDAVAVIELKAGSHWAAARATQAGVEWLRHGISAASN